MTTTLTHPPEIIHIDDPDATATVRSHGRWHQVHVDGVLLAETSRADVARRLAARINGTEPDPVEFDEPAVRDGDASTYGGGR